MGPQAPMRLRGKKATSTPESRVCQAFGNWFRATDRSHFGGGTGVQSGVGSSVSQSMLQRGLDLESRREVGSPQHRHFCQSMPLQTRRSLLDPSSSLQLLGFSKVVEKLKDQNEGEKWNLVPYF